MGQLAFDRVLLLLYFLSHYADGVIVRMRLNINKAKGPKNLPMFFMQWIESMDL